MSIPTRELAAEQPSHTVLELYGHQHAQNQPDNNTVQCWGRHFTLGSKFAIRKQLEPICLEIKGEIDQKLSIKKIIPLTLKGFWEESKKAPLWTVLKCAVLFPLCAYGVVRFVEGIIAGEVLLKNTPFGGLFSSNITDQLQAGGNITNAVQEIQFARDGILMVGALYFVLFRHPYRQVRDEVIDACYSPYLNDKTVPCEITNELLELNRIEHDSSWI